MKSLRRIIFSRQILAVILAGVFAFAALFSMSLGMQADEHGNMSSCPFMQGEMLVCPMGALEHIARWQQFVTAVFSGLSVTASIIFLLTLAFLSFTFICKHILLLSLHRISFPILKTEPEANFFNYFVWLFSRGILHPKIYSLAVN